MRNLDVVHRPRLSVVVACTCEYRNVQPVLASLHGQAGAEGVEIIVVDGSEGPPTEPTERDPLQRTMLRFPSGTPLPTLWGAGIAQAHGDVIAMMDASSVPDAQWITATLAAHESPALVVGGAVDPIPERGLVDWAAYFCEYGRFMRPLSAGVVSELPGNNMAFKRAALERGRRFVEPAFWKTYWCRTLQREGVQLCAVPSMVTYDAKSYRLLPFLVRRYHHGRCFAGMRNREISGIMRLLYFLGTPLLPVVSLLRIARPILQKRRYLRPFLLSLPASILAVVSWSVGEWCGYLAGPGTSCRQVQ